MFEDKCWDKRDMGKEEDRTLARQQARNAGNSLHIGLTTGIPPKGAPKLLHFLWYVILHFSELILADIKIGAQEVTPNAEHWSGWR